MIRGISLIFISLLFGCQFLQPKGEVSDGAIARVNERILYTSDLTGLIPVNLSTEDSLKFAEKFVNDWIKKQLMIARSQEEVDINEAEIQRKVLDYTYALTRSAYEKKYIEENLNENVSDSEINAYYQSSSADFVLKQNIVRCLFVQIPKEAPRQAKFRKDFGAYPTSDVNKLKEYCTQFASRSSLEDSLWVDFKEVIAGTPFDQVLEPTKILRSRQVWENSDSQYVYYLRILQNKMIDDISPLEFVREDIINIIINKRKIALKRELEDKVYEDASEAKAFEIFDR